MPTAHYRYYDTSVAQQAIRQQENPVRYASEECKMCVVVQHHLGKGAAARPRCIPQAMALAGD